jgi:hypothetical protein
MDLELYITLIVVLAIVFIPILIVICYVNKLCCNKTAKIYPETQQISIPEEDDIL